MFSIHRMASTSLIYPDSVAWWIDWHVSGSPCSRFPRERRIGINLGDVIEEGGRIYGDGVNIAARLEGLAEAGGICISGTAFDQVKNKLPVGYQYLGKQTVKNIPDPVRAYKVLMDPGSVGKVIGEKEAKQTGWGWKAAAMVAVFVLVVGGLVWNFYWRAPKIEHASVEKMAFPLPDKPSIAVLPFVNMSEDKSQEYFSDGLTEDIITALSKTPKLFVIARNSSFVYKGKSVNVQQVSRELGVKYLLEGSVRRSGDQLRITAQLIDATTGSHLWAERYDRKMKDIFAVQDDITKKITAALQVKLTEGEWASITARGTESLEVYLKIMEGRELIGALNRDDNALARKKLEEAIALDTKSAVAYAYLAFTYVMDFAFGIDREESMKKAFAYTQKALSLDDSQPAVYTTMEFMYGFMRRHEEAIAAGEKAVRLAPGSAYAQFSLGRALNFACRDREALMHLEMAVRMNPIPPGTYYMHIGSAHLNLRNYDEAVSALKKALAITPKNEFARTCLIVAYVEMGRMEEARAEAEEYRKTTPARPTQPEEFRKRAPWKDERVTERFIKAFIKIRS